MSVVAYDCNDCGVVDNCNVDETGQRTCPNCGNGVTGITRREAIDRGIIENRD